MKKPLVSIILSTYQSGKTLSVLLTSIKKQTYKPIETIIVDEWSDDNTKAIARKFGAKLYLHGKERSNNRNYGILKAKGKYFFILDADMELAKDVVKECVNLCESGKSDVVVVSEKSEGKGYWAKVRAFERIYNKGNSAVEASRFFPKRVIKKIGLYDPKIVGAEDWDLHQRVLQEGYTLAWTKSLIIHHEGYMKLSRLLRKKLYYGKAFLLYKERYPKAFKAAVVRTQLLKQTFTFLSKPKYGIGIFMLKFLEGVSLFAGMYMAKVGIEVKHY